MTLLAPVSRTLFRHAVALVAVLLPAACSPAPPPPTVVNLAVSTTADTNAGPDGQGAPLAIRIYQLASPAAFEAAPFFPLFNGDAATLKDDLVKRDDVLLPPGGSKELTLSPPDRAHAIGVMAAFREGEALNWRAVVAIPAHQTSTLTVAATKAGVTATIKPAAK